MSDDEICSEEYRIDKDAEEVIEDAVGEAVLLAWQSFEKLRDHQAAKSWLVRITADAAQERAVKEAKEMVHRVMSGELFRLQGAVSTLQWLNCTMLDSKVGGSELTAMMDIVKRISSVACDVLQASKDLKGIVDGKEESESQ